MTKRIIPYASAPCGAGKTYRLAEKTANLCAKGHKVLLAQPTKELANKTAEEEFGSRPNCPRPTLFNGDTMGPGVAKQLADHLANPLDDQPEILICTHQVLAHLPYRSMGADWHLLIDECPQVDRECSLNVRDTHRMVTDHLGEEEHNEKYIRLVVEDEEALKQIAYNKNGDDVYGLLQELARISISPHWRTFTGRRSYQDLLAGKGKKLITHSVLSPSVVAGFQQVFVCGANFEESGIYKLWRNEVDWRKDTTFEKKLRYWKHENGDLLTIYYATESNWTRTKRTGISGVISNLDRIREAASKVLQDREFVWQANDDVREAFFEGMDRIPNNPLGLNGYSNVHGLVFLSALNPSPPHCAFLRDRGIREDEIAAMQYLSTLYQSVMRTSLRNPLDENEKMVIVPDRRGAEYLAERLPGAKILKLETGIVEEIGKRGRARLHGSDAEKSRQWRAAQGEKKRQHLLSSILSTQDHRSESCAPEMRHENAIDLTSNFGTHLRPWGTLYETTRSQNPLAYVQGGGASGFIEFLKTCSHLGFESKERVPLFSPATFDPAKAEGKRRGLDNIVSVQNLLLDFENGDLRPEALSEIFPELEMVVTNTYNHTKEAPRFRVVIMTEHAVQPDVYEALWDEIDARLEEAGYCRTPLKNPNYSRSGLDRSKRTPVSLFRLPSKAKNVSDSFFWVYTGPGRKPIDPKEWIKSARISVPEYDPEEAPSIQPSNLIEESRVQAAIERWHSAKPGDGNRAFFALACELRDLGMPSWQIKTTLKEESKFGRSPDERQRQIPSIMTSLGKRDASRSMAEPLRASTVCPTK